VGGTHNADGTRSRRPDPTRGLTPETKTDTELTGSIGAMAKSKRSFVTLDGLRGIAALAVITRHAPAFFASISIYVQPPGEKALVPVGPFFESYLSVDFFFALSGFVLAHAYGRRLRAGMSSLDFMTIRIIRLYPLYLLALGISVVPYLLALIMGAGNTSFSTVAINLVSAILFLPSPASSSLFPLNGPAWSLFFELLANGCLALIARRLGNITLLSIVVTAGLVLAGGVAAGMFGFGAAGSGAMADGFEWRTLGAGCLRVAYSFCAGVLIYRIWCSWRPPINVPSLAVFAALIAILVSHPPERYQAAFDIVITILIFPVLIWFGASSVSSSFAARLFTLLGAASYGVYVLQVPLYSLTFRVLTRVHVDVDHLGWPLAVIFVVFVFAVAVIADVYFDRPVRAMLTARFSPVFDRQPT
jgi:peptidoglycan/LPS O-acetylase OafA/YrhL